MNKADALLAIVRVNIRVIPRASRTIVGGERDGRLVVRVTSPPVDGAANQAAISALAEALQVPERSVVITAGETSRNKTVEIRGMTIDEVRERLKVEPTSPYRAAVPIERRRRGSSSTRRG